MGMWVLVVALQCLMIQGQEPPSKNQNDIITTTTPSPKSQYYDIGALEEFRLPILPPPPPSEATSSDNTSGVQPSLTLRLLQKPSFDYDEDHGRQSSSSSDNNNDNDDFDDTGTVVWGASVCLGRYLADQVFPKLLQPQQLPEEKEKEASSSSSTTTEAASTITFLELGCGSGIPSLVACYFANQIEKRNMEHQNPNNEQQQQQQQSLVRALPQLRVIASDQEEKTLHYVQYLAELNNDHCSTTPSSSSSSTTTTPLFRTEQIQWGTDGPISETVPTNFRADMIVASDVIYSHKTVPMLVKTIDAYLSSSDADSKVYIALRSSRPGVRVFVTRAMRRAGFALLTPTAHGISCRKYQEEFYDAAQQQRTGGDPETWLPPGFQNEGGQNRWKGKHNIYIFEREKEASASNNSHNDEKQKEKRQQEREAREQKEEL